jgi:CubicO group peptidase (beta-lactamase class C family)
MCFKLTEDAILALRRRLRDATADPARQIHGAVATVVNRDGKVLFNEAAGMRGIQNGQQMTVDTIFWLASCTKIITGIAAMQLVEQSILALDDADSVERICPELKDVRILKVGIDGQQVLVEKKNRITLRMLLTHTGMSKHVICKNTNE